MLLNHWENCKCVKEKTKLLSRSYTEDYLTDIRAVYAVLDTICNETELYKKFKEKRDRVETYFVIHQRWLGLNHVNTMASETEITSRLQTTTYHGEKRGWY